MDESALSHGLECGVCYEKYDLQTHLPRILPHCGHTLCSDCIEKIASPWFLRTFTCPFDKTDVPFPVSSLNQFPPNFQLKTVIEARSTEIYCQEHRRPLDYVCLTHDVRICGDCVLLGDHKNTKDHNIQSFKKIKPFYAERKEFLEGIKKELFSFRPDIDSLKETFRTQRERSKSTVRQCFEEMKKFLKDEENKQLLAVENFFEEKVRDVEEGYQVYEEARSEIEKEIDECQKTDSREGPVKTLAEDAWKFPAVLEVLKKTFDSSSREAFFEEFLEKLELSLATQLSAVYSLKFDTSQIFNDLPNQMSSIEDIAALVLQDFDLVLKTLDLTEECIDQLCLPGLNSNSPSQRFETIQSLNRICISSKNARIFSADMMQKLQRVRVFLQDIQKLCICLNHSIGDNISEQTVLNFLQILFWNPLNISQIRLRLFTPALTDHGLQLISNKILPRTLNLQHLSIDFDHMNLTSQSIEVLLGSLAPMSSNLISLELDFSKLSLLVTGNFPCIGLLLPKLENFNVEFYNTALDDNSFDIFLKNTMDSLTEIRKFSLNLLKTKVTERKASEMFKKILRVFLKCEELKLGMSITEVSRQAVDEFINQSLVRLEKLEKISVFGLRGQIQRGFYERSAPHYYARPGDERLRIFMMPKQ